MTQTIHFKSQTIVLKDSLFTNPTGKIIIDYPQCTVFPLKSPFFHTLHLFSHQTHIPKPILCARKKRRGSGPQTLKKIWPKLVSIAASNLRILPEPFNLVIAELSSGGGSGSDGGSNGGAGWWFWKGFDGWRRKGKKINLGFLLVLGLGFVLFGKELKIDAFLYGVFTLGLMSCVLNKGYKRGVKDMVLVCFVCALMGLRLKREDVQQWLQKSRVCSPVFELVKGKRRRNGRRFL